MIRHHSLVCRCGIADFIVLVAFCSRQRRAKYAGSVVLLIKLTLSDLISRPDSQTEWTVDSHAT